MLRLRKLLCLLRQLLWRLQLLRLLWMLAAAVNAAAVEAAVDAGLCCGCWQLLWMLAAAVDAAAAVAAMAVAEAIAA
jgi:hypothetical protein